MTVNNAAGHWRCQAETHYVSAEYDVTNAKLVRLSFSLCLSVFLCRDLYLLPPLSLGLSGFEQLTNIYRLNSSHCGFAQMTDTRMN